MFEKACEKVAKFTHPIVVSVRTVDGSLRSSVGTYFFVNPQGWIITANHIIQSMKQFQYDQQHIKEVNSIKERDLAEGRPSTVVMDPNWITNHSIWFGSDGIRSSNIVEMPELDIALIKLENVPSEWLLDMPTFGDSESLRMGRSLCKLGYPFMEFKPQFENNNFRLPLGPNNFVPFPMDGIYGRSIQQIINGKAVKFIQTTTPGIKGQSGGPIFDVNGEIYGVQVKTAHFPLGFVAHVMDDNKEIVEHQFLNCGFGIPSSVITAMMRKLNIEFNNVSKGSDGCTYIIN